MAQTTLTIPDAQVDEVLDGLGWPERAKAGENKVQFLKRRIIEMIKGEVKVRKFQKQAMLSVPPMDIT